MLVSKQNLCQWEGKHFSIDMDGLVVIIPTNEENMTELHNLSGSYPGNVLVINSEGSCIATEKDFAKEEKSESWKIF